MADVGWLPGTRTRFVGFPWLYAALSAVSLADSALATPVSFSIAGLVTQVSDPEGALDPSVAVGASWSGFVSYEPPGVEERGGTSFPTPPAVISLEVGSLSVGSGPPSTGQLLITVLDGTYFGGGYQEPDQPGGEGGDWIAFGIALPASNGPPVQSLSFDFVDASGQAVSEPSVPTGPLDLGLLTGSLRLSASGIGGPEFSVLGAVDSLLLIPEPSTILLLGCGLAVLAAVRARPSLPPRNARARAQENRG